LDSSLTSKHLSRLELQDVLCNWHKHVELSKTTQKTDSAESV